MEAQRRRRPGRTTRSSSRLLAIATMAALTLGGCGSTSSQRPHQARNLAVTHPSNASSTTSPFASTASTNATAPANGGTATGARRTPRPPGSARPHRHLRAPIPDVGRLPQTAALPSAHTRVFQAEMQALWTAVRLNRPRLGLPAFFPVGAYVQVKSIYDARGDWQARLVAEFDLDVHAAHAQLGSDARRAQLVRVSVPAAYAHWIPPGVCDNAAGYYELPNARVVYRAGSGERSFGIASMISWRGLWFVVHFGAILRSTSGGEVDAASVGPGVSAPSSTC